MSRPNKAEHERKFRATPRGKFYMQRITARKRGIQFLLTFEEWWSIWQESGKWKRRGSRKGKYCMALHSPRGAVLLGKLDEPV